jgi:hypothetical protein
MMIYATTVRPPPTAMFKKMRLDDAQPGNTGFATVRQLFTSCYCWLAGFATHSRQPRYCRGLTRIRFLLALQPSLGLRSLSRRDGSCSKINEDLDLFLSLSL